MKASKDHYEKPIVTEGYDMTDTQIKDFVQRRVELYQHNRKSVTPKHAIALVACDLLQERYGRPRGMRIWNSEAKVNTMRRCWAMWTVVWYGVNDDLPGGAGRFIDLTWKRTGSDLITDSEVVYGVSAGDVRRVASELYEFGGVPPLNDHEIRQIGVAITEQRGLDDEQQSAVEYAIVEVVQKRPEHQVPGER